jgi:hypothetical protein
MTQHLEYVGKEKRERKSVVIDRELEKIYRKHKVVTVELVLKEAEKPTHALHGFFEWNDQAAAQKYRIVQCYSLILASKFTCQLVQNGDITTRQVKGTAQVRKLLSTYRGEGFRLRTDVLRDTESRAAVVEAKRSQLRSWCNSVIDISELHELRQSILARL